MPARPPSGADLRRLVPAVEQVLRRDDVRALEARHGRGPLLRTVREVLDEIRDQAAMGDEARVEAAVASLAEAVGRRLEAAAAPSLMPVINATGVVIHTNLGRAPLSPAAAARVSAIASSYSNLEFDLESGERGHRETHAESRLREVLGAEATVVVNNNAAAVMLAVNTLAEGREVVVSRGELVEIGGSFRIPDVLRKGGAVLREVGTTNRTRIADYAGAVGAQTGMILRVHPSNFRIVGFTEAPALEELVQLARERRLPLVEDLGSGLIGDAPQELRGEPEVAASLRAGVDLVTFSGDKLLGGPQAGLAVGRRPVVDAMRRNPLYRALRVDKMTIAALDAVLAEHEAGRGSTGVPVLRMLAATREELRARAEALARALEQDCPGVEVALTEGSSAVGGGAAPTVEVPTTLLRLRHPSLRPDALAAALRAERPPVIARVADDRLVLDLRTVAAAEETALLRAFARVLAAP
ncbi:MAG TPA: L-seryl-tRNA(Sec) selenium transferase [Vicinamibacteria bacterium]